MAETIDRYEPPSADTLAWEALRQGVQTLDEDQRRIFEDVASFIAERWPDDVDVLEIESSAKDDGVRDVGVELAELLGIDLETRADEVPDTVAEIAAAVKKALERERDEGTKDATIPSRANTAARKAMRLLVDGRVAVKRVERLREGQLVVAEVRGDSGEVYSCGHDPRRRQWRCTCPELKGDCSHIAAVKIAVPTPRGDPPA